MNGLLKDLTFLFGLSLLVGYSGLSVVAYWETGESVYTEIMALAIIAAIVVFLVSRLSWLAGVPVLKKVEIDRDRFLRAIVSLFFLLTAYIVVTAPGLPLLAWMAGAEPDELVTMREEFLKARSGWESVLPYLNSVMAGVVIPYAIAEMFLCRHRWRWPFFWVFFVYCVLFIEKVFFFKAILPLAVVFLGFEKFRIRRLILIFLSSLVVVFLLGHVSGFGSGEDAALTAEYFSNTYRPSGTLSYLSWRAIAVPLFTAADTLSYFSMVLNSDYLMGGTSSTISTFFGQERIFLERDVFAYQWGQTETGTGSSNAVFFVDAYVNFGYFGVIFYSVVVALVFKIIAGSNDRALFALWPLFFFGVYVSGLIGNLLSGGFLLAILFSLFFRLVDRGGRDSA